MRWLLVIALATSLAHADAVDDLEARGAELAKTGEYTKAIAAFKQAELQRPKAVHACTIGLAYLRRELWPQAELFFAMCHKRATPADQLPDWIASAEEQLAQRIADAHIAQVTIQVLPADAQAMLRVSSFASDEVFPAQTIHLAAGTQVIDVTAPGYAPQRREVHIEPDKPVTITLTLDKLGATTPATPATSSRLPTYLIAGGAAVAAAGLAYDLFVFVPARGDVIDSELVRHDKLGDAQTEREIAIGLVATGVVVTAIGLALFNHERNAPRVSADVHRGGAALVLEWHR